MMVSERFPDGQATQPIAVLFSGGLDSAVLLTYAAQQSVVQPIYVSVGLAWEAQERAVAQKVIEMGPAGGRVAPLASLRVDMRDVYPPSHWALRGDAPAFDTPDEDVYIEGRNIVLLSKAAVFMTRAGIERIMIGTLAGNPFPDASAEFFAAMAEALSTGLAARIRIESPFAAMHKAEVIRLGRSLDVPIETTLSCMQPQEARHCGRCSKCRERRDGFRRAGIEDLTRYESLILNPESLIPDPESRIPDPGSRIPNRGSRIADRGSQNTSGICERMGFRSGIRDHGFGISDSGSGISD